MRESEIEAYLVKRVREAGGVTYKFSSPSHAGVPDRVVILHGRVGFLELKAPGKKPTALQQREIDRISAQGVPAYWADGREGVDYFMGQLN